MHSLDLDRGPTPLYPFAADFVGDAVDMTRGAIGAEGGGVFAAATALAAATAAVFMLAGAAMLAPVTPVEAVAASAAATPAPLDPSRFILNALLVPALDADAVPLRWADPRPASLCGPGTEVRVNRAPLVAGALVPDLPFEVEWQADNCRPFGPHGPRYDGRVRLTVFREDWGLSAIVEPSGLRVTSAGRTATLTRRSGAGLPFIDDAGEPIELEAIGQTIGDADVQPE